MKKVLLYTLSVIQIIFLSSHLLAADIQKNYPDYTQMTNLEIWEHMRDNNPWALSELECKAKGGEPKMYFGDLHCLCGKTYLNSISFCVNNKSQEEKPALYEYQKNVEIEKLRTQSHIAKSSKQELANKCKQLNGILVSANNRNFCGCQDQSTGEISEHTDLSKSCHSVLTD